MKGCDAYSTTSMRRTVKAGYCTALALLRGMTSRINFESRVMPTFALRPATTSMQWIPNTYKTGQTSCCTLTRRHVGGLAFFRLQCFYCVQPRHDISAGN